MSQLKDRLTQFVNSTDAKSITDFERICGLSIGTIAKCKESVTSETLAKIARKYPSVDLYWILGLRGDAQQVDLVPSLHQEENRNYDAFEDTIKFLMKQIEEKDNIIRFLISQTTLHNDK